MLRIASRKLFLAATLTVLAVPGARAFASVTGTDPEPQSVTGTDPEPQSVMERILTFLHLA
jgi:hypothetical protein